MMIRGTNSKCTELMPREKIAVGNYIVMSYEEEYFPGRSNRHRE